MHIYTKINAYEYNELQMHEDTLAQSTQENTPRYNKIIYTSHIPIKDQKNKCRKASFLFLLYVYVYGCCTTKEDNNVIVVLQRQFISHLDRIKSTKHNTVFIVYSLLLLMRKEG